MKQCCTDHSWHASDAGTLQTKDGPAEEATPDAATKWGATGARTLRAPASPQSLARTPSPARVVSARGSAEPAEPSQAQAREAAGLNAGNGPAEDGRETAGDAAAVNEVAAKVEPAAEATPPGRAARPSGAHQKRKPRFVYLCAPVCFGGFCWQPSYQSDDASASASSPFAVRLFMALRRLIDPMDCLPAGRDPCVA